MQRLVPQVIRPSIHYIQSIQRLYFFQDIHRENQKKQKTWTATNAEHLKFGRNGGWDMCLNPSDAFIDQLFLHTVRLIV